MKKKFYILLLLGFSVSGLNAQWVSDTLLNTLVRDSSGTSENLPLTATLSDGSTYISWFEMNGGNYELRMENASTTSCISVAVVVPKNVYITTNLNCSISHIKTNIMLE